MPLRGILFCLVIGLFSLTGCTEKRMITLEKKMVLTDYPSGSSLEYYKDQIYLIGDDASSLIILDKDYNVVQSIEIFDVKGRIPKKDKTDLEASTLVHLNGEPQLLMFGSASNENREKGLLLTLDESKSISSFSTNTFFTRLKQSGIEQVNVEGAAMAAESLVLANRANGSNPINDLVITNNSFINEQDKAPIKIIEVRLPPSENVIGISGLAYDEENDILLFTASTELTNDVINDGEIGDSYIGWIRNAKEKFNSKEIKIDTLVNLFSIDERFSGEKIESVTVETSGANEMTIHLASDNDNGQTCLFKCKLKLK